LHRDRKNARYQWFYAIDTGHSIYPSIANEKDKNDKYIRRERYAGSMSRSFYVGENMKEEDIHAFLNPGRSIATS